MKKRSIKIGTEMTDYNAIGMAEGFVECPDEETYYKAWQHLIDTGVCWKLQGWFGRQAHSLIEEGICNLPPHTKTEGHNEEENPR
jgi:hypothetical protein